VELIAMFRGLLNTAKAAVSSAVLKYVARASVAIPFVIAAGFALAAGTVMLVERMGAVAAYWCMAGGLAAVGVVAAMFVSAREQEEEIADAKAEKEDTSTVAAEVAVQAPLAVLGALFSLPGGAGTALTVAKMLGRNYALVLFAVLVGALFWPTKSSKGEMSEESEYSPAPGSAGAGETSAAGAVRPAARTWATCGARR
jgi:hypothetical protein